MVVRNTNIYLDIDGVVVVLLSHRHDERLSRGQPERPERAVIVVLNVVSEFSRGEGGGGGGGDGRGEAKADGDKRKDRRTFSSLERNNEYVNE